MAAYNEKNFSFNIFTCAVNIDTYLDFYKDTIMDYLLDVRSESWLVPLWIMSQYVTYSLLYVNKVCVKKSIK